MTLAAPVRSRAIQLPADSPDSLKDELVGSRMSFDIEKEIKNIHHILIFHGSSDVIVPVENAEMIYRLSTHPKKQTILENGDHRMSNPLHQAQFIKAATDWFW